MEETNALSPEIRELFEKVALQTVEFEKTINLIEEAHEKIDLQKKDLDLLAEQLSNDINLNSLKLKNSIDDSLRFIEQRSDKINAIYSQLDDLIELKESLVSLKDIVKRQSLEIETTISNEIKNSIEKYNEIISSFKSRSASELDREIASIKGRLESEIKQETGKIEQKLAAKLKTMDNTIQSLDNRIIKINDSQTNDSRRLHKDFDSLKNMLTFINSTVENRINDFDKDLDKNNTVFTRNIQSLNNITDKITKNQTSIQESVRSILLSDKKEYDFEIKSLSEKVIDLDNQLKSSQNLNIVFAAISCSALLIALLIVTGVI